MISIEQNDFYKMYWYDDAQTILVVEVYGGWTWADAQKGLKKLNDTIESRAEDVGVYVIIDLQASGELVPKHGSILGNIRNLLQSDPQHEQLTIYITQNNFLRSVVQMASHVYKLRTYVENLRFVSTFDEAIKIIQQHKQFNQTR